MPIGQAVPIVTEFTRPANATAYAANDVLNTSETVAVQLKFANVVKHQGGSGFILGAMILGETAGEVWSATLYVYNRARDTVLQDNAAWSLAYSTDMGAVNIGGSDSLVTSIAVGALEAVGTLSAKQGMLVIPVPFKCAEGSRDLYFELVTGTIFTPGNAKKYTVILYVEQDPT